MSLNDSDIRQDKAMTAYGSEMTPEKKSARATWPNRDYIVQETSESPSNLLHIAVLGGIALGAFENAVLHGSTAEAVVVGAAGTLVIGILGRKS